ncbi:hypothetical protein SDC9_208196 [bioreactor metagenome]|uniref:Uncharacterized protein n=1 Tax=bioreactor metagenome TaxID=1076179 RepID=A0A645J9Y8_9ZZZZ
MDQDIHAVGRILVLALRVFGAVNRIAGKSFDIYIGHHDAFRVHTRKRRDGILFISQLRGQ